MKTVLPFLLLIFSGLSLSAQNYQVISGQLLDQKTGKGIPYANIGIPEKGIGTTSNDDGKFTFKVPKFYANSNLIVSVIGYKTYNKPLNQIISPVLITLEPTSYALSEIQIVDESGVENIIRKAVKKIPENYPIQSTTVLGFYRESRTDSLDEHVYLAEGVLNIHKTSYKNTKEGMVSLVQGRKINLKNPLDTVIIGGFSSGHMAAHRFDFVKNREDFIDEDFFPAYKYWIENITTYNGRQVYVIGFDKDPNAKNLKRRKNSASSIIGKLLGRSTSTTLDARLKGKLYIEKESYAFIKAEFEVTEDGLRKYNDYPLYSGRWTFNKYVVNYQQVEGKWYFSDALREGGRRSGGVYSNEIKITEIDTDKGKPIPYLDRLDRGEEFVDMTGTYDENFWKSYNTVPMSEKLSESMQQFSNAQKAQEVFAVEQMQKLQELRDSVSLATRIQQAEEEARKNDEYFDPEKITFGEPGLEQKKKRRFRLETMLGLGSHFITTPETHLHASFLDSETANPLLNTSGIISSRDFEIIATGDFNIIMNDRWFLRFGGARDFGRTIYKESASGMGVQFNLSKQRPVFLKFIAQHSRIRYARLLGLAENKVDNVNVGGKNFNAKQVRVFYGSRTNNLKLSGEFAIELNRNKEIYIRGSYYLPYAQKQHVYFREATFFFKKRTKYPVESNSVFITSNENPRNEFNSSLMEGSSVQLTIGYVFK
ncbi:carboxypeptidase-like regulatory domain-containing protein [Portibacter lacus]|uniref:Carboxypeptidase-like regulatory domain-containing protein n=1 Tax=Portibacter lacus TaxID=1099794 RepID=A0AA37SWV0_9BACT|nr:carboxypeptidase-like regulatory domain-containing protein [Portibacter lacus]GLR19383.1 hypothetical protein GCM10007940_39990 [Portibacter lacus]